MDSQELKSIRIGLCLTQSKLAQIINVSVDAVKSWETGRRKIPGPVKILIRFLNDGGKTNGYLER